MANFKWIENSDLTKSKADIICHQVNCKGKMSSCVAKAIMENFPTVYNMYTDICFNKQQVLDNVQIVCISDIERNTLSDQYVANMFAQNRYGYDDARYTDYEAFYNCLEHIKRFAK